MAIGRDTTAKNIKPLRGAVIRRGTSGAAIAAGEIVEMQSDGYFDPADASAAVTGLLGIAIQAASAAGEVIDIVTHGPVKCLTGATPGALVYVSDTAGEPSESAGTKDTVIGHNESATVLYVDPQIIDFS
jgi:hypothetical protein